MRVTKGIRAAAVVLMASATAVPTARAKDHGTPEAASSEVASAWLDALYDVIRTEATAPPAASRIYGLTAVALYEAVVPGSDVNRSLVGQLNGLDGTAVLARDAKKYHWPAAANAAVARTIRGLMPSLTPASAQAVNALESRFESAFERETSTAELRRSVAHGQAVADAIRAWAAGDGFGTANNCPYVPAVVDGAWQPTPPANAANPLQPCWGQIRAMVLASGMECAPPPPPAFSTEIGSACRAAAQDVYDTAVSLTTEQAVIADFWADNAGSTGTPPGHWMAIVGQIARRERLSLMAAAEVFAGVGIAVHDAFIACWHTKYLHNLQRPVTYIRNHIAPGWLPRLGTPPFPTYTSGHSTQSGAAATVLTAMFGARGFTDTTRDDHALTPRLAPRSFASFDEAAAEAAVSRLYGGIHFSYDNDAGLLAGRCIGQRVVDEVRFR